MSSIARRQSVARGDSMFAPDGCVQPNIPCRDFMVGIAPKCEHGKIRESVITVSAPSAEDALSYVQTWLRFPNTHIVGVKERD